MKFLAVGSRLAFSRFRSHVGMFFLSFGSLVLGFLREVVVASFIGASSRLDVFLALYLPYDLLLPIVRDVPSALVGLFAGSKGTQLRFAFGYLFRLFFLIGLMLILIYLLVFRVFFGFSGDSSMVYLLAASVFLLVLHAWFCSYHVLNGAAGFQLWQPIWLNLSVVVVVVLFHSFLGVAVLGVGVLLGTILLLGHEAYSMRLVLREYFRDVFTFRGCAVSGLTSTVFFVAVQAAGSKGGLLVDRFLGLDLPAGSVSYLNYAMRIWGLPISLVVIVVALLMVPKVAAAHSGRSSRDVSRAVVGPLVVVCVLSVLFAVFIWVAGEWLVMVVFERGMFHSGDSKEVSRLLSILVLGGVGAAISTVLARVLWLFGRSFEVAVVTWLGVGCYAICAPTLVSLYGVVGLAVGNVIMYNCQAIFCCLLLRRELRAF